MARQPVWESTETVRVERDALGQLVLELLTKRKMFKVEAQMAVDRMFDALDWGFEEHGPARAHGILSAIDLGDIDARAQPVVLQESSALAVIDGSKGVGEVAATRATDRARKMAAEHGTATVVVRNSRSWGSSAAYAARLADEGLVSICSTSEGQAAVSRFNDANSSLGGADTVWGVPSAADHPVLLAMNASRHSTSLVDRLELFGMASEDHQSAGSMALWLQSIASLALTGLLSGSKLPTEKRANPHLDGAEHFIYCIDVSKCCELDEFKQRAASWYDQATDHEQMLRRSEPRDLELHSEELAPLIQLAKRFKVESPLLAETED